MQSKDRTQFETELFLLTLFSFITESSSLQEVATYVFGRARPILKYQFKSQGFFVTEF